MAAESPSPSESAARVFALFGLEPSFEIDQAELEDLLRQASLAWHPDRFAAHGPEMIEQAEEKMAEFNEGFARLSDPVRRAELMLDWLGAPPTKATDHKASPEFLMEMMELREEAEEAQAKLGTQPEVAQAMLTSLAESEAKLLNRFSRQLQDMDLQQAAEQEVEALQRIYYEHRYYMRTRQQLAEATAG